ncbi:hypothetical protein NW766_008582 [Fusarium irregulare]|uniref:beta-glucosidase n=1 Tax=Fusarium irregulare TaxID=2494466 RepID=A0A9W8U8B9_9HYPO|nr:hypothetical protein NW766_008582 [Fusarium irregulare]
MPALAGLATRMGTMRHGDRYLAGLWEKTLLFDLLWFVESNPVPGKPKNPRFPSWNWASVNCQVMWSENIDSTLTSVRAKEVRFVATGPSHLGEFSEATVAIQAPLVDASLFLSPDRHTPHDASHNDVTMEQLYLVDYKVDCLPPVSSPTHYKPDPSGFVVPIGVSMAYHIFSALYVRLRPGSTYYERLGTSVHLAAPSSVVFARLPGQDAGSSLVEVRYGDQAPSGRLRYTVAETESDYGHLLLPVTANNLFNYYTSANFTEGVYIDYRRFNALHITSRFEFGFGLTYTIFEYADLKPNLTAQGVDASTLEPSPREILDLPRGLLRVGSRFEDEKCE